MEKLVTQDCIVKAQLQSLRSKVFQKVKFMLEAQLTKTPECEDH